MPHAPRASATAQIAQQVRRGRETGLIRHLAHYHLEWTPDLVDALVESEPGESFALAANPHLDGALLDHLLEKLEVEVREERLGMGGFSVILETLLRRGDFLPSLERLERLAALARERPGKGDDQPHFQIYLEPLRRAHQATTPAEGREEFLREYRARHQTTTRSPDMAGRLLLTHPLFPGEWLPRLLAEYPSASLLEAVGKSLGTHRPELARLPEIRQALLLQLPHPEVARALLETPHPADFALALAALLKTKQQHLVEEVVSRAEVGPELLATLPRPLLARLLAHPESEIRLKAICAAGMTAEQTPTASPSPQQRTP